mmetsp:Transcript_4744/g.3943  ORF Transcript_4744/g.3943 Transcript_4744/m.3943 type:complete len:157 (+) Transcript_4744:266-736(+)
MNRDTAQRIAEKLNEIQGKKMVYLSASRSIPFIPRYLDTKIEAENYIKSCENLRHTFLRPGFIYSTEVYWRHALKLPVNLYSGAFNFVNGFIKPKTVFKSFLNNIDVDSSVSIKSVSISALIAAFDSDFDGRTLYNDDMETLKTRFLEKGYDFKNQ